MDFLQFQYCYEIDIDVLLDAIDEVKGGVRERDELHNHTGAHVEPTANVARIYYVEPEAELDEEKRVVLEMPIASFERLVEIWRVYCEDYAFAGTFNV